jgi:hypothetical protein
LSSPGLVMLVMGTCHCNSEHVLCVMVKPHCWSSCWLSTLCCAGLMMMNNELAIVGHLVAMSLLAVWQLGCVFDYGNGKEGTCSPGLVMLVMGTCHPLWW